MPVSPQTPDTLIYQPHLEWPSPVAPLAISDAPIAADTVESASAQSYELRRYPYDKHSQLKAWDAADQYLLAEIAPRRNALSGLCIVHDNFGALSLPLSVFNPVVYGDSWMSFEAIKQNLARNQLSDDISFESALGALGQRPNPPSLVVGRVPRSKAQLAALLSTLHGWVEEGCELILAGMDKHLSRGQFELLGKYFGPARYLPGVKKARLWHAVVDKQLSLPAPEESCFAVSVPDVVSSGSNHRVDHDSQGQLNLLNAPNVFSRDSLDIGTRFFLQHFNRLPLCSRVADLACGSGVLGLAYLGAHADAGLADPIQMYFCDESFQAVASTRQNLTANFSEQARCTVEAGDGLKSCPDSVFDLVLCNPPFHQQNALSLDISRGLFRDALRCLRPHGELWIVANRHLGYHQMLKTLFGNCVTEESNAKFVILKSIKPV